MMPVTPPTPQEIALVRALDSYFACGRPSHPDTVPLGCLPLIRAHVAANAACPHVIFGTEGTQYCGLAESAVAALSAKMVTAIGDHHNACGTIANMHAAAVGSIRGPFRGVVEDVADLKKDRDELAEWKEKALVTMREMREGAW